MIHDLDVIIQGVTLGMYPGLWDLTVDVLEDKARAARRFFTRKRVSLRDGVGTGWKAKRCFLMLSCPLACCPEVFHLGVGHPAAVVIDWMWAILDAVRVLVTKILH